MIVCQQRCTNSFRWFAAIARAVTYEDRRDAISTATICFDHNMQSLHDEELEVGADAILMKHLGFLVSRRALAKDVESSVKHELCSTCEAIEMVYRASPQSVSQSFDKFGLELLGTLIHLINKEISDRAASPNPDHRARAMSECFEENENHAEQAKNLE